MTPEQQFAILIDSLALVASPADEQLSALPEFVCVADEIVGGFSDAFHLVDQLVDAGLIDANASAALTQLDDFFDKFYMEAPDGVDDLQSHPFWKRSRELALEALRVLGLKAPYSTLS